MDLWTLINHFENGYNFNEELLEIPKDEDKIIIDSKYEDFRFAATDLRVYIGATYKDGFIEEFEIIYPIDYPLLCNQLMKRSFTTLDLNNKTPIEWLLSLDIIKLN